MIVASTIVPCRISRPRSSSIADDFVEQRLAQLVPLQPMAEVQDRRLLRHRRHRQIDPGKAAQRLAVVQRILHRPVGQPVPLLQKVDPQHPLQTDRRPAALALRVERGRRSTSRDHGTTCSISAKNLSRRVCFFLPAYSACEKLP